MVEHARMLTREASLDLQLGEDWEKQHEVMALVMKALKNKDVAPALEWTLARSAEGSHLAPGRSELLFQLRQIEFVLLVRSGRKLEAVRHMQSNIAPVVALHGGSNFKGEAALPCMPAAALPCCSFPLISATFFYPTQI